METKPHAESGYAEWLFHVNGKEKKYYQLAPQLFDPETLIIPYLIDLHKIMAGRTTLTRSQLPKSITSTPGNNNEPYEFSRYLAVDALYDLGDLFAGYWWEVYPELDNARADYLVYKPGFLWNVFYDGGPLELSFRQYNRDGTVEPMFDIGRASPERVVELMRAPEDVTNLFKL